MGQNALSHFLKGMGVGASMLIPGVSGGTMAMILGIYDALIDSVSNFFSHIKKSLWLLGLFSGGALIGILLFAKPLLYLTETYTLPMMYFFMGAVAGSIPMIYKKAHINNFSLTNLIYPLLGGSLILVFSFFSSQTAALTLNEGAVAYLLLVLSGVVAAIALVLPGISVSYMLLLMGMHETTMNAISTFYLPYLIPLGFGILLGIVLTTRLLEYVMTKYARITYLIILGFIIGSVAEVFPGLPTPRSLILCVLLFCIGYIGVRKLSTLNQ